MPEYGTKCPCCAISTNVSRVDNKSKSRVSNSVCRNILETSGKSLVRIHEHLAALLESAGGLVRENTLLLDGPGSSGEVMGDKNTLDLGSSERKQIEIRKWK